MQELLNRVGILVFVKFLIECWNEAFILLLLMIVLIEIYNYKKKQICSHRNDYVKKYCDILYYSSAVQSMWNCKRHF